MECKSGESPSSSMDSCSGQPAAEALSTASSGYRPAAVPAPAMRGGLSTDLRLGLTLSPSSSAQTDNASTPSTPRSSLTAATAAAAYQGGDGHGRRPSLFVKVYMEGIPIGRKLDLMLLNGYDGLLAQLARMFRASITYPDVVGERKQQARHVLTYQDQEGDWMMIGDVPWEYGSTLFLTSVKKLRIARADKMLH